MLRQRVITAIVLFAVLFAAGMAPGPWPLILVLTAAAVGGLWEWLRLVRPDSRVPLPLALLAGAGLLVLAWQWQLAQPDNWAVALRSAFHQVLVPLAAVAWLVVAPVSVLRARVDVPARSAGLALFALLAVPAAWFALVQLLLHRGALFLVTLMALIWCADIAAYFCGKAFGRHKLAPRVSPGKTWEGAFGGVAAAVVWILACAFWPSSYGAELDERLPLWLVVVAAIFLASLSIIGDLFESLLKRRAGRKDSSSLLPGHGGVYDRIDALLPVAPLAYILTGVSH